MVSDCYRVLVFGLGVFSAIAAFRATGSEGSNLNQLSASR